MKLNHLESSHQIEIDDATGLLTAITYQVGNVSRRVEISTSILLEIDGKERRAATGGLEYFDFQSISSVKSLGKPKFAQGVNGVHWQIPVSIGQVSAELLYRLDRQSAAFSYAIAFNGDQQVLVRDLETNFEINLSKDTWLINMPGNGLRKDVPLSILKKEVGISPVGGLRGSSGVVHLDSKGSGAVALWPSNRIEIPELSIKALSDNQIQLKIGARMQFLPQPFVLTQYHLNC